MNINKKIIRFESKRNQKRKNNEKMCFVSWKTCFFLVIFSLFLFLYTSNKDDF